MSNLSGSVMAAQEVRDTTGGVGIQRLSVGSIPIHSKIY